MKVKIFAAITLFALSITITINARADNIHSVWVQDPLYLYDGDTGIHYNPNVTTVTINWKENTLLGFFNAKAEVGKTTYQFQLVSISNSDEREIEGFWDIWRNGTLVCSGCVGKAYGLDGDIGNYFKLYTGTDSQHNTQEWHLSGYITNRLDYYVFSVQ